MLPELDILMEPLGTATDQDLRELSARSGVPFLTVFRTVKLLNRRPSYDTVRRIVNARAHDNR